MHEARLLHKLLAPVIHLKRVALLEQVVTGLLKGKTLSLTALGRALVNPAKEKNNIKKVDRLLANPHLASERSLIYKTINNSLLKNSKLFPVIIDWSALPSSKNQLLRAAIPFQGRAISLYEEVHSNEQGNNPKIQKNFLHTLKTLLPLECTPIIITDAGFATPWFTAVEELGWHWIGRIRNHTTYCPKSSSKWIPCKDLHKSAKHKPQYLGQVLLTKHKKISCGLYQVKHRILGRQALNSLGYKKKGGYQVEQSMSHREPWILATSLPPEMANAKNIVSWYGLRMQIEEAFRDCKSSRYGFGFEKSKTKDIERIQLLLLIAMLATFLAILVGIKAEQEKIQYDFQANSLKHRRVLSLFYLGCRLLQKNQRSFTLQELLCTLTEISRQLNELTY